MKTVLLLLIFFLLGSVSTRQKYTGKEMAGSLPSGLFSKQWFRKEYRNYHPDETILKKLEVSIAEKKLLVLIGAWCSDSQREFPRLMKVLDKIHFSRQLLTIYSVTRDKLQPAGIINKYNITKVPTIILLNKNGTEKGRITESVKVSMESDLESLSN